jgi:hypothetical protein
MDAGTACVLNVTLSLGDVRKLCVRFAMLLQSYLSTVAGQLGASGVPLVIFNLGRNESQVSAVFLLGGWGGGTWASDGGRKRGREALSDYELTSDGATRLS